MEFKEFSKILEKAYNKDYPSFLFVISTKDINKVEGKFFYLNFQVDIYKDGLHLKSFDLGQVKIKDNSISVEFIHSFFNSPNFNTFKEFLEKNEN